MRSELIKVSLPPNNRSLGFKEESLALIMEMSLSQSQRQGRLLRIGEKGTHGIVKIP